MRHDLNLRGRTSLAAVGSTALLMGALGGCQSYSPQALDLSGHASLVEARSSETESVGRFAERLGALGPGVPERFDLSDGLAPSEAEVLALFYNADLRLARLEAASALASLGTAGLWEDPVFGFDAAEILSPEGPLEFGLRLEATIPVSGRLQAERDREAARYQAELSRLVAAEWSVRMEMRRAWAVWTDAVERRRLLEDFVTGTQRVVDLTDRLEEAGELPRVESRAIRGRLQSARLELASATLAVAEARSELLGLMGLGADASIEFVGGVSPASAAVPSDPIDRLIGSNPTLDALRASYQVAEEELRVEIRKQYPDLTIGAGYGNEDDDRLLLGFAMPIPVLNANRAGIASARADRDMARAQAETGFERLARQLGLAIERQRLIQSQREAFERDLIPLLDEQLEEVEELMDLGQVDTLLLLESLTSRLNAKSRLLDLRLQESLVSIEIDHLLGPVERQTPAPVEAPQATDAEQETMNAAAQGSSAEETDQ